MMWIAMIDIGLFGFIPTLIFSGYPSGFYLLVTWDQPTTYRSGLTAREGRSRSIQSTSQSGRSSFFGGSRVEGRGIG